MVRKPDISVELALENSKFKRELQESVGFAQRSLGGLTSAAGLASRALGGIGVVISAGAVASFAKDGINAADTMSKMAQRAGVTTEAFSRLSFAADLADVSSQELQNALSVLGRRADEAARGGKTATDEFARMGVSVRNSDGSLKSVERLFSDVAEEISKLPDGAEKSARAFGLLGRAGAQLLPLLSGGASGLREAGEEAVRFGQVVSTEGGRAAEEFNDNLTRMGKLASGVGIQLGADLLPHLNNIVDAFKRGYEQGGLFDATLKGLEQTITEALGDPLQNQIEESTKYIGKLKDELKVLKGETFLGGTQKAVRDFFAADNLQDIDRVTAAISRQEKKLADLRQLQEDLRKPKAATTKPTAGGGAIIEDETAADAAAKAAQSERDRRIKAQDAYLSKLRTQLELQGEVNELAKLEADIKFGTARNFDKAVQDELRQLADKADVLNEEAEVHQYLIQLERDRRAEAARTTEALGVERARVIESLRTPEEEYSAEVRKLLDLGIGGEDLQRGIDRARESLLAARDTTKEATDAALELGFAFESAFESAVLDARDFGDVLKGLLQDVVKIGLRKSVTDPLAKLFQDSLGGILTPGGGIGGGIGDFFSGLFGNANGGLYRVAGVGTSERPVMLTAQPGEGIAVGNFGQGGGNTVVNVINPPAQPKVRESVIDGEKKIDIVFQGSFGRSLGRGDLSSVGLPPPLASR